MPGSISPEEMKVYKETARLRLEAERKRRSERRDLAWHLARRAAELLKSEFGVTQVVLFGSLLQEDRFVEFSDVDLAAWGLTATNWLQAMGAVRALSNDIELNVVDVGCCPPDLLDVIGREGSVL